MTGFDRSAIAARIRGLLAGQDGADPTAAALRLGVDEVGLRMSIDELAPNPTIEVIARIVAAYGVDPTWLLTGAYDAATHRPVLEETCTPEQAVSRLMNGTARGSHQALRLVTE